MFPLSISVMRDCPDLLPRAARLGLRALWGRRGYDQPPCLEDDDVSAPTTPSLDEEALPPEVIADPAALHLGALGPVGEKVEDVERIAVLRANGIGDLVVAVPPYPNMIAGGAVDETRVEEFFERHRAAKYDLAVQLHGGGGNSNPFV